MSFLLNYIGRGVFNIYVGLICLAMVLANLNADQGRPDRCILCRSVHLSWAAMLHGALLHSCEAILLCSLPSRGETGSLVAPEGPGEQAGRERMSDKSNDDESSVDCIM